MLKRQNQMMAAFSMASMTDVIFLLLIFFMVTSTFVFPTGLEVSLPQSTEQSAIKPGTRVYIDAEENLYASTGEEEPQPLQLDALVTFLQLAHQQDSTGFVALYADETVTYARIVEVLNAASAHDVKMVLATKPVSSQKTLAARQQSAADAQPAEGAVQAGEQTPVAEPAAQPAEQAAAPAPRTNNAGKGTRRSSRRR